MLVASAPGPLTGRALGATARDACAALGARVSTCSPIADCHDAAGRTAPGVAGGRALGAVEEAALDAVVTRVVREAGKIDLLAVDGAGLFAAGLARSGDGRSALRACLDAVWNATRAVANHAFLPSADRAFLPSADRAFLPSADLRAGHSAEQSEARAAGPECSAESRAGGGGRVVYLAPFPDADRSASVQHAAAACAGLENLARTLSIEWARHRITTVVIAPGLETTAGEVAALVAYLASPAGDYFSGCVLDLRGRDTAPAGSSMRGIRPMA